MDAELHREFIARNLFNSISFSEMYANEIAAGRLDIQGALLSHRATFFFHRPEAQSTWLYLLYLCIELRLRSKAHSTNDDTISREISSKR